MRKYDIGIIGLGVMGKNLAHNIASAGFSVAAHSWSLEEMDRFNAEAELPRERLVTFRQLTDFIQALERPRKILLMVKAGSPVDEVIQALCPLLDPQDIMIDGGNSFFKDTQRRVNELTQQGIHLLGVGISGGEAGARYGPAMMPGGDYVAYEQVKDIFEAISAKVDDKPCTTYIGPDGAGHYVKMVHNGIEYGDMQLISEVYFILKHLLGLDTNALAWIFSEWNKGELNSYLMEITAHIFATQDELTGEPLIEKILDAAEQKGTGMWTSQSALELGVPLSIITEAVFARFLSSIKQEREYASIVLTGPKTRQIKTNQEEWIETIRQALYMGKICSYAQGFAQLRLASHHYGWQLNYGNIANIFRGGCIIRAAFLDHITAAFQRDPELKNLLLDPYFKEIVNRYESSLRKVVSLAIENGLPVPGLSASLAYFDSYRTAKLPANLIQAQRDYFGAHTYKRIDREGTFHTNW